MIEVTPPQSHKDSPLVSCLCVTENRAESLDLAIKQFYNQTYENKELIVVYKSYDEPSQKCLDRYSLNITKVSVPDDSSLGEMRNASISAANGDFVCQWDDDDWYSPRRIESQLRASIENNKMGSILIYVMLYDELKLNSYLSLRRPWDGSLFLKKEVFAKYNIYYPSLPKGEDAVVTNQLIKHNLLFPQISPLLYTYKFTGANTWNEDHFNNMFNESCLMEESFSTALNTWMNADNPAASLIENQLMEKIDYFYNYQKKYPATINRQ